ncbi:pilin N-terminal domain-containing protein, partial [Helcococcus kunzii]|uniref:pilin N-terminal domain-containing protein n=1 Tax=Helcococcus kunzii TaxID=40091 RepID=UPI0024ACCAA3
MKRTSKLLALLLAFVMSFAVIAPAANAQREVVEEEATKTEKVTLHKLLLDKETFSKWNEKGPEGYDGTQDLEAFQKLHGASTVTEIAGVYFVLQNEKGDWIDKKGNPVKSIEEAEGGLTTSTGLVINTSELPQDQPTKYRIVEVKEKSTYVGKNGETLSEMKAVPVEITLPLINKEGIQKEVHVYPKNTEAGKPENTKTIGERASEEIKNGKVSLGDTVPYEVNTTIKAGSTYNKIAWTDKMSKGLKFDENVEITSVPDLKLAEKEDYTITYSDNGFVLQLTDNGLAKVAKITAPVTAKFKVNGQGEEINGKNIDLKLTLRYSATVNSEAFVNNPLENTNTLHYGNNPGYTPEPGDNNPPVLTPNDGKIVVDKSFTNEKIASGSKAEWPSQLEINVELQVYNPETNKWVSTETIKTLNSETTKITFDKLDNSKQYRVVEKSVKGWVPNYSSTEDGKLVIVNKKNDNPEPITPDPVIVRTSGKKFVKTNQDGSERLDGAEFIITNKNGDEFLAPLENRIIDLNQQKLVLAETEYQNAVKKNEPASKIAGLKKTRDAAAKEAALRWTWVKEEKQAHVFVTDKNGQWGVYGLAYGEYSYIETKAPKGYANNSYSVKFTVDAKSYSETGDIEFIKDSNIKDATQIINKKVTIPQTGGIGTLIFTVVGLSVMAA